MTLRWLEVFVVVAKHLSITLASRELHVSQPAISQQLECLQDSLGVRLIRRTPTGIELTEDGAAFLGDVETILSQLSALKTKYAFPTSDQPKDNLVVGASHGTSASLVPELMAQFAAKYPAVHLRLYTDVSAEIESLVIKSEIDLAVTTQPGSAAITSEPYQSERLVAFAPADHPLTKLKEIRLGELTKIPLVVKTGKADESRTEKLLRSLHKIDHSPKISMRCDSPEAVKTAVRNGAGVGILYFDSIRDEVRRKEFVVVRLAGIELKSKSYILYHKTKPLSAPAEQFLSLLRAARHIDEVQRLQTSARRIAKNAPLRRVPSFDLTRSPR